MLFKTERIFILSWISYQEGTFDTISQNTDDFQKNPSSFLSLVCCFRLSMFTIKESFIETSNLKILSLKTTAISVWQILELLESGIQITQKIPLELLGIWRLRWCVARITESPLIISLLELSLMSVCSEKGLMLGNLEKKSETLFFQSKYKSSAMKCLRGGVLKPQIS